MDQSVLTVREGYLAMYDLLYRLYEDTGADYLANLLGDMSLLEDGVSADPAMSEDWEIAVSRVKEGKVDASLRLARDPPG